MLELEELKKYAVFILILLLLCSMLTAVFLSSSHSLCYPQFGKQILCVLIQMIHENTDQSCGAYPRNLLPVDFCPFISIFFFKLIVLLAVSLLLCSTTWTCSFNFLLTILCHAW